MRSNRWIQVLFGVAVLAVAALALSYGEAEPSTADPAAGSVVESVTPGPGDLVPRQSVIEVDLESGYGGELWILMNPSAGTWQRIPEGEVTFIEGTGVYTWTPGEGKVIDEWDSGEHTLKVIWNTLTGLPDVGEYEWSFRTY